MTLTGPGGTGKTRLALQAGAELLDEFEGGVFFVELAAVTDTELVASAVAGPLGVVESPQQPLRESLKAYLREKELLLVLDNFEQVLEGAPLVGDLLSACPHLKVLATSRIPLRLYGEREYPVGPLELPDPKPLPESEQAMLGAIVQSVQGQDTGGYLARGYDLSRLVEFLTGGDDTQGFAARGY